MSRLLIGRSFLNDQPIRSQIDTLTQILTLTTNKKFPLQLAAVRTGLVGLVGLWFLVLLGYLEIKTKLEARALQMLLVKVIAPFLAKIAVPKNGMDILMFDAQAFFSKIFQVGRTE